MHSRVAGFFFPQSLFLYVFCPSTTIAVCFTQSTCRDSLLFLPRTENTHLPSKNIHQLGLGVSEEGGSITPRNQNMTIHIVALFH